jgi:hypothetical protein
MYEEIIRIYKITDLEWNKGELENYFDESLDSESLSPDIKKLIKEFNELPYTVDRWEVRGDINWLDIDWDVEVLETLSDAYGWSIIGYTITQIDE